MRKHIIKLGQLTATLLLTLTVMAGCSEETIDSKERMQEALAKQTDMHTFSFEGSGYFDLGTADAENSASSLAVSLFTNGQMEWSGTTALDPFRLELLFRMIDENSSLSLELPLIVANNHLYLQLPIFIGLDEYYSIDLAELEQLSGQPNPLDSGSLQNINRSIVDVFQLFIEDMDEAWFSHADGPELKDGSQTLLYRLDIADADVNEQTAAVKGKLPEIIDLVATMGLWTEEESLYYKNHIDSFSLETPGFLEAAVDDSGFLRQLNLSLAYRMPQPDGEAVNGSVIFSQTYYDINVSDPVWRQDIPQNPRPLQDILRLFMPEL